MSGNPLSIDEVLDRYPPREATTDPPEMAITTNLVLPADDANAVSMAVSGNRAAAVFAVTEQRTGKPPARQVHVQLNVAAPRLGVRTFPPGSESVTVALPDRSRKSVRVLEERGLDAFVPDHLPFRPVPLPLEPALRTKRAFDPLAQHIERGKVEQATTIFPPDERTVYSDTSYPWSAIGLVSTAGGQSSGCLVGPRHLLTCSHAVTWNADGSTGWMRFTPGYFDTAPGPFGDALVEQTYQYQKVSGPTIDGDEGRHDYVVCVLSQALGTLCGYLGTKAYTDSWDGSAWWTHAGYPTDLAGGQRPIYQNSVSLDGAFFDADTNQRIYHQGDVWPGQSGGPFFAWWDGKPYVVAVQSSQTPESNAASGGDYIVSLVNQARTDFP